MKPPIYITPVRHFEENTNIFVDDTKRYFFWDECRFIAYGPFSTELEVKYEMFRHGEGLEGIRVPEFAVMKPFFDQLTKEGI